MWIAVVDVVGVLTDSADPRQYIEKMRSRDPALDANWGTTCTPLALQAPGGKQRETNCANTEGLLRIIQSIPSPERAMRGAQATSFTKPPASTLDSPQLALAQTPCHG